MANALVIRYALAETGYVAEERSGQVWSDAAARMPSLLLVQMVTGVLIFIGLLFLIVPGVWLIGVLMPAYVLVVAEQMPAIEAVKQAWVLANCRFLWGAGSWIVSVGGPAGNAEARASRTRVAVALVDECGSGLGGAAAGSVCDDLAGTFL